MSVCDRLTDYDCAAIARVLFAWGKTMDAAGLQPAAQVPERDMDAVRKICEAWPLPPGKDEGAGEMTA